MTYLFTRGLGALYGVEMCQLPLWLIATALTMQFADRIRSSFKNIWWLGIICMVVFSVATYLSHTVTRAILITRSLTLCLKGEAVWCAEIANIAGSESTVIGRDAHDLFWCYKCQVEHRRLSILGISSSGTCSTENLHRFRCDGMRSNRQSASSFESTEMTSRTTDGGLRR